MHARADITVTINRAHVHNRDAARTRKPLWCLHAWACTRAIGRSAQKDKATRASKPGVRTRNPQSDGGGRTRRHHHHVSMHTAHLQRQAGDQGAVDGEAEGVENLEALERGRVGC
jgi:hypothetical protein